MTHIEELTEQLASRVMIVHPDDPPALVDVYTRLEVIAEELAALPPAFGPAAEAASDARQGVERIVLRDVADATTALADVAADIERLQGWVRHALDPASNPSPAPSSRLDGPVPGPVQPATAPGDRLTIETPLNPDDLPLVAEFITEARGHLESAEAQLLKVEEDPRNLDAVNTLFRAFHTIKGVAGFLNLRQIGALAHSAEGLLDRARQGKLLLSGGAVDVVLAAMDLMKDMVGGLEASATAGQPVPPQAKLGPLVGRLDAWAAGEAPEGPVARPGRAEEGGHELPGAVAEAPATTGASSGTTRSSDSRPPHAPSTAAPDASAPSAAPPSHDPSAEASVKVSTARLDSLVNTIGELVIAQSMVSMDMATLAHGNQRASRNLAQLGKITRELQDLSMSMRMVPIQGAFQKMARLLRDLCRKTGKEIDLEIEGGDTELDRTVVEAIADPLVHMVRNAADHGIEPREARELAGKLRAGRISLRAYHQAGTIVIEISDDGQGLRKDKILRKAVEAGIVRPEEAEKLSEQQVFGLIFHAGLSTADKVTEVSGRGVGMDVVKRNVEALRGRIEIASKERVGTTFTIRLPLTMAVIDGLIVRVGDQRYIIPITSVEQSIRPCADQLSTVLGSGEMCLVRERLLPLLRLHRLFGIEPRTQNPGDALVVVVQDDARRACLLVDELVGQQQVVIKSLNADLGHVRGVSGGAILGDGNVSLILDVPGLIDLAAAAASDAAA